MLARLTRWLRGRDVRGALIGLLCALTLLAVDRHRRVIDLLEDWTRDFSFMLRGGRATRDLVTVAMIDDRYLEENLRKPFIAASPEIAKAIDRLRTEGAAVVGVDVFVARNVDDFLQETLAELDGDPETVGKAAGRFRQQRDQQAAVIFPVLRGGTDRLMQPSAYWTTGDPAGENGLVDLIPDDDTFVRRQYLTSERLTDRSTAPAALRGIGLVPVFSTVLADRFRRIRDGTESMVTPPLDRRGKFLINYVGQPGAIRRIRFADLLNDGVDLADAVKGRVVIIGSDATLLPDPHVTPFANQFAAALLSLVGVQTRARPMAGPEIHANVVATLLDEAWIHTPWWLDRALVMPLAGVVAGLIVIRSTVIRGLGGLTLVGLALLAVSFITFVACPARRVECAGPLLVLPLVWGTVFALRWRWLRRTMGLVRSEAIARALENDPDQLLLKGQEREITVLFADIRGFTSFSQGRPASQVVSILNEYFSAIVPAVEAEGGVVDKYIGDGIMVLFNAPDPLPDHAARAVRAGRAMIREVERRREKWRELGFPELRIGVGVHSGPAIIGTMGSRSRLEYSAVGETVNTASRLEGETKGIGEERGEPVAMVASTATVDRIRPEDRGGLGIEPLASRRQPKGMGEIAVHLIRAS